MLRRVFNSVIEATLSPQYEPTIYPCPFTQSYLQHLGWLTRVTPCFPISSKNVSVITEPKEFYDFLHKKCLTSSNRITLASLYFGNGKLEQDLVNALQKNENFTKGQLEMNVLLDYTRGSRFSDNSRTTLLPLLKNNLNCQISLYHTPVLRGVRKRLAPHRWNELFGLQHMKLYIFDDTLIISGANLSNDYFTNRQDRYFVINDRNLCNFYCGLVKRVQAFSLQLDKNDKVSLSPCWTQLPYEGSKGRFIEKAGDLIEDYLIESKEELNGLDKKGFDTWVFPLVQMGQLGVQQDASITDRIFAEAPEGATLNVATGYFNLTRQYMKTIMYNTRADCRLLMAHPNANGFKGAKGLAGGIPDAYSLIAQRFRRKLERVGQDKRVTLQEYLRPGWTYHAKGLWYYPPGRKLPCLTLIGSPNFGERSVKRDLETQIALVTENEELQKEMHRECESLYSLGLPAMEDRIIPKWVYAMVFLFRGYF